MMNSRRAARLRLAAIAAVLLASACDRTIATLSPDNLSIEVQSEPTIYAPRDEFVGTLGFHNRTGSRIRAQFPTTGLFHIDILDADGNRRRSYSPDRIPNVTYLELAAYATRTDSLRFPLYSPPESLLAGSYLVRGWVDGHPDISAEAAIEVR